MKCHYCLKEWDFISNEGYDKHIFICGQRQAKRPRTSNASNVFHLNSNNTITNRSPHSNENAWNEMSDHYDSNSNVDNCCVSLSSEQFEFVDSNNYDSDDTSNVTDDCNSIFSSCKEVSICLDNEDDISFDDDSILQTTFFYNEYNIPSDDETSLDTTNDNDYEKIDSNNNNNSSSTLHPFEAMSLKFFKDNTIPITLFEKYNILEQLYSKTHGLTF